MALTHLLDTSVLSQPIKDRPVAAVLDKWSELGEASIATSAVCLAELIQGLEWRMSRKYWRRYQELLEGRYPVLPFDQQTALLYGKLSADLRREGLTRPVRDIQIAATARGHGLIVATLDMKDFADLPGVRVEDWSV